MQIKLKAHINILLILMIIIVLPGCNVIRNFNSKKPKNLNWDFSNNRTYCYFHTQEYTGETTINNSDSIMNINISREGFIDIISEQNGTAKIYVDTLQTLTITFDPDRSLVDSVTELSPPKTYNKIYAGGSFEDYNKFVFLFFQFPLPKTNIIKYISDTTMFQMDILSNEVSFNANYENILTFEGYELINSRNCIKINSSFNMIDLTFPTELTGDYIFYTSGNGTYYFDTNEMCFVSSELTIEIDIFLNLISESEKYNNVYSKVKAINHYQTELIETDKADTIKH